MRKETLFCAAAAAMLLVLPTAVNAQELMEQQFSFADLADYDFGYGSGVGAWGTSLDVSENGDFSGSYHDSEMGSTGDGYPGGTLYWCNFTGTFTEPVQIGDYVYAVQIENLQTEEAKDVQEIRDEILYIASDPYGVNDTSQMYIYLPGIPVSELPENFTGYTRYEDAENGVLPGYGIYNPATDAWFVGTEKQSDAAAENSQEEEAADVTDRANDHPEEEIAEPAQGSAEDYAEA